MDELKKRQLKQRNVLLATVGLLWAPVVALFLKLLGISHPTFGEWTFVLVLTLLVQSILWLIPHRGWDVYLRWDPKYLYLPMVAAALLLLLNMYFAPEGRFLVLMGWFVAVLFMVTLAGFLEVVLLTAVMTGGYLAVTAILVARGELDSLKLEVAMAVTFFAIGVYAGFVCERLRRQRQEMKELRRELEALTLTDGLTGLPNRRHFESTLRRELARIRRHGGACAVALMDVDHFKDYNDQYGHLAGDTVLKELGRRVRDLLRRSDLVARFGGDEFAVILFNTPKVEALAVLDKIRRHLAGNHLRPVRGAPDERVTISAGIAGSPEDGGDYEEILHKADQALYTAKDAGRNRVQAVG